MHAIYLEYAGEVFPHDTQPWLDQHEDDSGEEPLFTLVTVRDASPDRDALALALACACVGNVPADTTNLVSEVRRLADTVQYTPGRPLCVVAHWSTPFIPPINKDN